MKKNSYNILLISIILLSITFTGCAFFESFKKPQQEVFLAEEGPLKLIRFTDPSTESVAGPAIFNGIGKIRWTLGKFIDINPKNQNLYYLSIRNGNININEKETSENNRSSSPKTFRSNIGCLTVSPNGDGILFVDNSSSEANIFSTSLDGSTGLTQITHDNGLENHPCYSKDGKTIYYTVTESATDINGSIIPRYYIWGVDIKTGTRTQYVEGMEPTTILKSDDLLLTRYDYTNNFFEIWRVDLNKGKETRLLSSNETSYANPDVSPDGKKITFVSQSPKTKTLKANLDIYICNIDGSQKQQLTYHGGADLCPVWSKDGNSIFFISSRANKGKKYSVWKMNVPKSNIKL
jgi:Tol biopolymer transport system component